MIVMIARNLFLTSMLVVCANAHEGHSGNVTATGHQHEVTVDKVNGVRKIVSNGIPNHETGQFPNRNNPNSISEQKHVFQVPLNPQESDQEAGAPRGMLFGVGVNGVPFDPGTAETWQGNRDWTYEAIGGKHNLGLDSSNAHVQPTGTYHYHGVPHGLAKGVAKQGGYTLGSQMTLVGWAADGFPIYYKYGYKKAEDKGSGVAELKSSYRLREGERSGGPGGKFNGEFASDYEYVTGLGDLDEHNGRYGVTPEYPNGTYHYVATEAFPFISRSFKGTPDPSFMKRRGREGGGRPQRGERGGRHREGPPPHHRDGPPPHRR